MRGQRGLSLSWRDGDVERCREVVGLPLARFALRRGRNCAARARHETVGIARESGTAPTIGSERGLDRITSAVPGEPPPSRRQERRSDDP